MRFVILPQALRRVVPPLLNDFIGLQKDTAFIGVIGVLDGFRRAQIYAGQKFNLSSFTGLALCFVVITIPMTRFTTTCSGATSSGWLTGGGERRWPGPLTASWSCAGSPSGSAPTRSSAGST
jgi:hypothetical protein